MEIVENQSTEEARSSRLKLDSTVVGVARVGTDTQKIVTCSLATATKTDLGTVSQFIIISQLLNCRLTTMID